MDESTMALLIPIIVPTVMFIALAAVLYFVISYRHKNRADVQATVRHAMEHGQQLTPELLEKLGQPVQSEHADLRKGAIAIAIALAFAALAVGVSQEDAEALGPMLGIAAFPLLIGLAYIGFWWFANKKAEPTKS